MYKGFYKLLSSLLGLLLLGSSAWATDHGESVSKTAPKGTKNTVSMTPEILLTMARVGGFSLSPDGKQVVYTVSYPSIQENRSTTKLFLVSMEGTNRHEIATSLQGVTSPIWIDGGKKIALMAKDAQGEMQLYTFRLSDSQIEQLSTVDGGITGFLFSPDEKCLIYTKDIKYGETVQDKYPDLPKSSGRIVTDLMYKHWDEWVSTIPHPFLVQLRDLPFSQGKDILEGEPYEAPMKPFGDLSDFSFSPDGNLIAYACRKKTGLEYSLSTNSDIYIYNIRENSTYNLTEGMMGYDTHPTFSPDGKRIAWCSMERDGYESDLVRLFIADLATGKRVWLTEGFECNVESPTWTPDGKSILFVSCVKALTDIYKIDLKSKKIAPITKGVNDYVGFDLKNGKLLAARHSMLVPTDLYSVNLKGGEAKAITAENKAILEKLGDVRCEKRIMRTTSNEDMLVWVMYPANFDPAKKYPSILYCQGGPQGTISQFWSYRWNPRIMAEHGYIVILPNRHGVPSFGKAWNEQISGDYPGQNMKDYMTAADEMKKEPYIAKDKMGCVGASYGGYSVYWLAGNHENRFACFIAHAGIFDMEAQYYQTEEKWFANWDMGGAPWEKDNAVAQRTFRLSPNKFVDKWDKPILVIHGEKDYRILASQGMMAFDAAKMHGVPAEMLIFPNENHWILQPQNAVLWQRTFFEWLDKWLKGEGK